MRVEEAGRGRARGYGRARRTFGQAWQCLGRGSRGGAAGNALTASADVRRRSTLSGHGLGEDQQQPCDIRTWNRGAGRHRLEIMDAMVRGDAPARG